MAYFEYKEWHIIKLFFKELEIVFFVNFSFY